MLKKATMSLLSVLFLTSLAHSQESYDANHALLHDAGFSVKPYKIDGPDYYGREKIFREAYDVLRGRYGNDYLPDELPLELLPVRAEIHKFIQDNNPGRIVGGLVNEHLVVQKESDGSIRSYSYEAGENGINNGEEFDFSIDGLPDKITRLSYCFGISPRILTAKISLESDFIGAAISATGAVGFSQLTSTGIVEVSEQLGFGDGNKSANHNPDGRKIYEEYIDCYLKDDQEWIDPWSGEEMYRNGDFVAPFMHPDYWTTIKTSSVGRSLDWPYSSRMDKWLSGRLENSSHDNGLIYGAILLKYFLGHYGVRSGVREYNGDDIVASCKYAGGRRKKRIDCYELGIFQKADRMDMESSSL